MNKLDRQYTDLLQDILDNGITKSDRTGTGTLSVFGRQIRHKMSEGFPLITTKKMYFKGIVTELLWFLRGDTNIKYLVDNDCHIWDGDCFSNYLKKRDKFSNRDNVKEDVVINGITGSSNRAYAKEEFINKIKIDSEFAKIWGDLGPIYGKQWRSWEYGEDRAVKNGKTYPSGEFMYDIKKESVDQISNLINDLKTNPDSRRLMVNAWNVGELDQMVLPPCHYGFQVYTRKLSREERTKYAIEVLGMEGLLDYGHSQNDDNKILEFLNHHLVPLRAISLMWNQRSCDFPLGIPYNIASYGLLLVLLGKIVNMIPDELIGNLGDCHIYHNQIEGVREQLTRAPYALSTLKHMKTDTFWNVFDASLFQHLDSDDFIVENYKSHSKIYFPLSN